MNSKIYTFGLLSSGYKQYPEDNTVSIFKKVLALSKAETQICTHRYRSAMFYIYTRKLSNVQSIGFCIQITNAILDKPLTLFPIFEELITELVKQGSVISLNEKGNIVSKASGFVDNPDSIALVESYLRLCLEKQEENIRVMPPINYAVAQDSIKYFSYKDDVKNIFFASFTYGYMLIFKGKNYNTSALNGIQSVIAGKQKEIEKLSVDNAELNKRVVSLSRQKKQFKKVIFLTLTIIAFGVGIFYLHDNLANTRGELSSARNTIVERNATIFKNKTTIKQKENKISELNTSLQNEKAENDKLNKKISDLTSQYPIAISEIEVNSEEFSFDYDSQEEKELTFTLKAINERNGYIISNSHTLTYYADGGHKSLRFSSKLNTSDYYYVILMYDGKIIAGKRW